MRNRTYLYYIVFFFSVFSLFSFRGYEKKENLEWLWLDVLNTERGESYYIEINNEGDFLMTEEKNKKTFIREGNIKKMYAKDLLRETKNSEIINAQQKEQGKMLFYKGETISITLYLNGELKRVSAQLKDFNESFNFAFSQVRGEIDKVKPVKNTYSFLVAYPLEGEALKEYERNVPADYELKVIEFSKLKKQKYLYKAISYPYRHIKIESKKEENEISDFINREQLYGIKSLFYLGTGRGNFKCSVIDSR